MEFLVIKQIIGVYGVFLFLAGFSFLAFPSRLKQTSKHLNKWYSVRRALKPWELLRPVDDKIHAKHKMLGVISVLVGLRLIYCYSTFCKDAIWSLTLGTASITVGILFLLFPANLLLTSNKLNRWFSTHLFLKRFEMPVYREVEFYKYNKILGVLSLVIGVTLFYYLIKS